MTSVKLTDAEITAIAARNGITAGVPPQNIDSHASVVYVANSTTGETTSALGLFSANANGAGYTTGDLIVLRQTGANPPEYYNVTTGAVITPNTADLSVFGASDLEIRSWAATAANAGIGYATGDVLTEILNTATGGASWYLNGTAISTPPIGERELAGGSSSGGGIAVTYSLSDGVGGTTATALEGAWDIANAQVYPVGGSAAISIGTANGDATDIAIASGTSEGSAGFPVLYNLSDGAGGITNAVSLKGFQVGASIQPENYPAAALIPIGTAAGEATNLQQPKPVLLQEQSYQLSNAVATFDAYVQPANGATVVLTNGVITSATEAAASGIDTASLVRPGATLMGASEDGATVGGIYEVVSGSLAALTVRRVDDNIVSELGHVGQTLQTVVPDGANTGAVMSFAVVTHLPPVAGEAFRTIQFMSDTNTLVNALASLGQEDTGIRGQAIADLVQFSSRSVAVTTQQTMLHVGLGGREFFADGDSKDFLEGQLDMYLLSLGASPDRNTRIKVSHFAGYYVGGCNA